LANWLAKRANELGRSRSDLVRQALEEQRQGKNSKSEKSCAELMAEFSGFFQGPRDLSTNPKHMRDFGKWDRLWSIAGRWSLFIPRVTSIMPGPLRN
jgi:hypothetical protein